MSPIVSVDFNRQTLKDQLLAAGYDSNKSTVFTLEGVSQYISTEAIRSTLKEVSELTKQVEATFYLSYVDANLKSNPQASFGTGYKTPEKKPKSS